MKLTSAPKLSASMRESPLYRVMGVGLTDTIFLLAHHGVSDGSGGIEGVIQLNTPYPVGSMQEAINDLGADIDSPLLTALMEAYYSGARDIWLVAIAPMDEYEPNFEDRDNVYYWRHADRLSGHDPTDYAPTTDTREGTDYYTRYSSTAIKGTYDVLKYWDIAHITVPVEAPFNSTIDFLGPLIKYCVDSLTLSGDIHLGILGTRGPIDSATVDALISDGRLGLDIEGDSVLGEAGKFVGIFVGDGTYQLKEMLTHHTSSVAVGVAAELAQLPLDRGMTYKKIRNIINMVGPDLSKEDINRLAEARLNAVGRNIRGRRNYVYEIIVFTDNTLAWDGSDYWAMLQTRLISAISAEIRSMGSRKLGTIGFDIFKTDVEEYLLGLVEDNIIRSYEVFIRRDFVDPELVLVDVDVIPFFGVRELHINTTVGPAQ